MKKLKPKYFDPTTCVDKLGRLIVRRDSEGQLVQQPVDVIVVGRMHRGHVLARAIVVPKKFSSAPPPEATGQVAEVFGRNYDAMTELLARTGVGRRTNMESWRPTKPTCGAIPGVYDAGGLTILAHDGILGIFERRMADDSVSYLVAHTQRFTGTIESLWATESGGTYKGPRKPKSASGKAVRKKLSTKELLDLV